MFVGSFKGALVFVAGGAPNLLMLRGIPWNPLMGSFGLWSARLSSSTVTWMGRRPDWIAAYLGQGLCGVKGWEFGCALCGAPFRAHAGVLGGRRAKLTREGPQNLCAYMRSNSRPSEASAAKLGVRNSSLPGCPAGRCGAKLLQPQSSMTR